MRKRWSVWTTLGGVDVRLGGYWTRRGALRQLRAQLDTLRRQEGMRLEVRLHGHPGPWVSVTKPEVRHG